MVVPMANMTNKIKKMKRISHPASAAVLHPNTKNPEQDGCDCDIEGEGVRELVGVIDEVGVTDGEVVGVMLGVRDSDGVGVRVGVSDGVMDTDGVVVTDGVTEGV